MKTKLALVLAAAVLGGCRGDDPATKPPVVRSEAPPAPPRVRAVPARPRDGALIRRGADPLRAGHVSAAARLFHVPAIAENGTGELALQSFAEVRLFNESLPCGAELLDARRVAGGYTLAVFRLTDRPGGDCGSGAGQRAATAFRFSPGRIKEGRGGGGAPVPP